MIKTTALAIAVSTLMMGCAHQGAPNNIAYDPATDARIRVYFGVSTYFYANRACEPKQTHIGHGGGAMQVAKPRKFHLSNTTVGMPVPEDAYKYYDEYIIKANQPLTITMDKGGWSQNNGFTVTTAHEHAAGTFVPQAGADYEVFDYADQGYFRVGIRQLRVDGQRVVAQPLQFAATPMCH